MKNMANEVKTGKFFDKANPNIAEAKPNKPKKDPYAAYYSNMNTVSEVPENDRENDEDYLKG